MRKQQEVIEQTKRSAPHLIKIVLAWIAQEETKS